MDNYYFGTPKNSVYDYSEAHLIDVSSFDKNFITGEDENFIYINADNDVFALGGIKSPRANHGEYYRLDASQKEKYVDCKDSLSMCTPGATLRFYTNAEKICLKVKYRACILGMHHFCDRGVYGFDMYTGTGSNKKYCGAMMQTFAENPNENSQVLALPGGFCELTVEFPLYGGIDTLSIGFPKNCKVASPAKRSIKPIAFYGSSITQGGCVSRPGSMYSNIICRALDCDNFNMGYSGSAFGEQFVAEWIASLDLSCFVMDYDYNSRSVEELKNTHLPFYETIRKVHKDMPIILVTHPCFWDVTANDKLKSNIVKKTYNIAEKRGDNVFFVDGGKFFPAPMKDLFCVDNLHPNDLGHYYMAKAIFPVIKKALEG